MDPTTYEVTLNHYLDAIQAKSADREMIRRCLIAFPTTIRSRGLFFEGVQLVLEQRKGAAFVKKVVADAGLDYRISSFGFYPHRDFYRLFFATALAAYPHLPLGRGLERIAEEFYPAMFAKSLVGKTLSFVLTKDPANILARLVDAYGVACEGNTHVFTPGTGNGPHRWTCSVEPCDVYPDVFQGIARGMLRTVAERDLSLRVVSREVRGGLHHYEFAITIV